MTFSSCACAPVDASAGRWTGLQCPHCASLHRKALTSRGRSVAVTAHETKRSLIEVQCRKCGGKFYVEPG